MEVPDKSSHEKYQGICKLMERRDQDMALDAIREPREREILA